VLDLIDREVLSKELVLTAFKEARLRKPRVPMAYFPRILAILAGKQGVEIPF
jgi:hypothetical protein